jgi:pilus assembly protein TadC
MMVDDDGLHDFEIIMLMTIDIRIYSTLFIFILIVMITTLLIWRNGPAAML